MLSRATPPALVRRQSACRTPPSADEFADTPSERVTLRCDDDESAVGTMRKERRDDYSRQRA